MSDHDDAVQRLIDRIPPHLRPLARVFNTEEGIRVIVPMGELPMVSINPSMLGVETLRVEELFSRARPDAEGHVPLLTPSGPDELHGEEMKLMNPATKAMAAAFFGSSEWRS